MEREHQMTVYAGRHRKTSTADHRIPQIVTKTASAGLIGKGILYVSLTDAATGNTVGIDFEPRAVEELRRVLDQDAA
jgi:hypothetical protein